MVPLLLQEARRDPVLLARVVRAACEAPADLFGFARGRLEQGRSADFMVVDPREPLTIRGSNLASKCGWTPFEGWPMARIEAHFLRGEPIVEGAAFIGRPGHGRPLQAPAQAAMPGAG